MKVIHILIGGEIGGIETLCRDYTQYSVHENIVIILRDSGPLAEEMINNGIRVIILNIDPKKIIANIKKVIQVCKQEKADVAIVHHAAPISHLCLIGIKMYLSHVVTVAYAHGNAEDMCRVGEKKGLYLRKFILKRSLLKADRVIAISQSVKSSLLVYFKIPTNNIKTIYNGVDINKIVAHTQYRTNFIRLVYVGRLIKEKGVQVILEGLSLLPNDVKYSMKIVGDGVYREELERIVKQFDLEKEVEFLGERRDVPNQLSQSDIFVHLPIWEEGFGITIAEAMAAGLVCICAKSGAIPEIIVDGINGFLVEKGDAKDFSQRLVDIIKEINSERMKELRKNSIKDADKYSIEKFTSELDLLLVTDNKKNH